MLFQEHDARTTPSFLSADAKRPAGSSHRAAEAGAVPLRIAIDGPLRAGKSTLAWMLAERLGAALIAEPEGNPFLPRFYAGEPGMAFAAQMWFLRVRSEELRRAAKRKGPVVCDYLLEKDRIFAHLNLSDAELALYKECYAAVAGPIFRPDLVVYLEASPAVLHERRRRKGIDMERGIGAKYTEQVCEAYAYFYSRYTASRLLVVDTDAIDFVNNERERELLLDRILAPVYGREHFAPLAQTA